MVPDGVSWQSLRRLSKCGIFLMNKEDEEARNKIESGTHVTSSVFLLMIRFR